MEWVFSLPFARRNGTISCSQLLSGKFVVVFLFFFPPGHIIAGNLPWGLQLAGRWIAAGSHLPGELGWSHPLLQNSAQSSQRPSGISLGSHGSAGTLSYPSLREEKVKCNETRRSCCSVSQIHPPPFPLFTARPLSVLEWHFVSSTNS